jgi:RIO kinase 1
MLGFISFSPTYAGFEQSLPPVDLDGVMREIDDAKAAEAARLLRMQELE